MKTFLLLVITFLLLTIVMANGYLSVWATPFALLLSLIGRHS